MSAYIVDPRTIDYLVQWAQQQHTDHHEVSAYLPDSLRPEAFTKYPQAVRFGRLDLTCLTPDELGQLLLDQNVRSVQTRYLDCPPDDLPGPNDQTRVRAYRFKPISNVQVAAWVISACRCLGYQSCETDDWEQTLAYAVMQAIREDAIQYMTRGAPWGVTDGDLVGQPEAPVRIRLGM